MRDKRFFAFTCLLALSILMCQCPASGWLSGLGGALSPQKRQEVLDSISEFQRSFTPEDDPEQVDEALIEYMTSLKGIQSAGSTEDGSVWGQFADGRMLILAVPPPQPSGEQNEDHSSFLPRKPSPRNQPQPKGEKKWHLVDDSHQLWSPPGRLASSSAGGADLPGSSTAVVVSALPLSAGGEWGTIAGYLREKNYDVNNSTPTVRFLKNQVKNVGVFYFATHGGSGRPASGGNSGSSAGGSAENGLYALETATDFSSENEASFADDLDRLRLVYFNTKGSKREWRYGITNRFVERYMSFSENSFVFIGACSSFNEGMIQSFSRSNTSLYAGWTAPVGGMNASFTPMAVFQLLLGVEGHLEVLEETAHPFRPFDHGKVWDYLKARDMDHFRVAGFVTYVKFAGEGPVILAPSIKWLDVDEPEEELQLTGTFGDTPGRVTINGQEVSLVGGWNANKLRVNLPKIDAPNGFGDVEVTVKDHRSNPVPLTRWQGELTYTVDLMDKQTSGLKQKVEVEMALRADIHPYRENPEDQPKYREGILFKIPDDLSGNWSFTGKGTTGACFEVELGGGDPCQWS